MVKIKSYLGLSVKSGAVVIGQDKLKGFKKSVHLIVVSPNATQNLIDLSVRLKQKFGCECIKTNTLLEELINIAGCKIVGLTNNSLAQAVLTQSDEYTRI